MLVLITLVWIQNPKTGNAASSKLTNDYIKEREEQLADIEEQKAALQSGIKDSKNLLSKLQGQQNDLAAYVTQVDAAITQLDENIRLLNDMIEAKEVEIEDIKRELEEARQTEREQYEAMKVRIRFMYEEGEAYYMELLFSAKGFADMLNKADYIEQISEYDRKKLEEYILNEQLIEICQAELEEQQALLEDQKTAVEEEKTVQEQLMAEAEQQISEMQLEIDATKLTLADLNAQLQAETDIIEALEAQIEAERKRLEEQNRPQITYDGGMFTHPCPGYIRISDSYGWRMHPILKQQRFHSGIDFAASKGTPILAAYDGSVTAAAYSSSMGNYIMINHGNGLYTVYMHCSALYVSAGQDVTAGQTIAAVGTTGMSTGNHLHFSVRLNGEYVDPANYLSSM